MAKLQAVPEGKSAWHYRISDQNGFATKLVLTDPAARCCFDDGKCYTIIPDVDPGVWALTDGATTVCSARRPSTALHVFTLSCAQDRWVLETHSPTGNKFVLKAPLEPVGSIRARGLFGRRAEADLPATVPRPVGIFLIYLVLLVWRGSGDSAARMDQSPDFDCSI